MQSVRTNPYVLRTTERNDSHVVRVGFLRVFGGEKMVGTIQIAALARYVGAFFERGYTRSGTRPSFFIFALKTLKTCYRARDKD